MSDYGIPTTGRFSAPSTITELHSGFARIEERLQHVIDRLEKHIDDEHADLKEALLDMKELRNQIIALERKLDAIHTSARVTRWVIATIGALVAWAVAVRAGIGDALK